MVPVYDSDIAEERWSKSEWNHYELWEKVEQRMRKHNRIWIAATVLVFLLLSSVPIVIEQRPKWKGLGAVRRLGQVLNQLKREAAVTRLAYRIRFSEQGGERQIAYQIESAARCDDYAFRPVRSGDLMRAETDAYVLLSPADGQKFNIPDLMTSFCYDPLAGSSSGGAFAVIPAVDLATGRTDRLSLLWVTGPSADVAFE